MRSNESDASFFEVAIITRTKDRPFLLRRAIASVLKQSFQDWVHVIINDGGDAACVDLLAAEHKAAYRGRLLVIHNHAPEGMQNASNRAIRSSQSNYVTIHDDDDSWEPLFLEKCVSLLQGRGAGDLTQGVVVASNWIFEEINVLGDVVELWRKPYPAQEMITLADMAGENRYPPIAFLYRRQVHEKIGYFDQTFSVMGDWDFNLRFLCHYDIEMIPEALANWHWRQQGGAAYGNSSTTGVASHRIMTSRLMNHYLRKDLESGHAGLGQLMNTSRQLTYLSKNMDELRKRIEDTSVTAAQTLHHASHFSRITRDLTRVWQFKDWLMRSAAVVRERCQQPACTPVSSAPRNVRGEMEQILSEVKSGDVLSLDVFDTALFRVLGKPTDLFGFIEPDVRALPGLIKIPFSQARRTAELVARQRFVKDECEDVTLEQIYEVFAGMTGADAQVASRAMNLELDAERELCRVNPLILELYRAARSKGVRVIFVSDMYLPESMIRELLEHNGYDSPEVYVSSSVCKTKHSGALFESVMQALGVTAGRIYHIGDHPESDGSRPRMMGIRSIHINRLDYGVIPWVDQHTSLTGSDKPDILSSVFRGLVRTRAVSSVDNTIWRRLGYELVGPMAYAFTRWIALNAEAQGIKHLFFLARDGYLLEKIFRTCSGCWGLGLDSTYMYSSRRLINMARIERLDEAALNFLLTSEPFLRVRDFLVRIGLPLDSVSHSGLCQSGLSGFDQVVTTQEGFFQSAELRERMKCLLIGQEPRILEMAAKERETLFAYFKDIRFSAGDSAIVDLGWQASSILSLQNLLRLQEPGCRLTGFYFGTWTTAAPVVDAGGQLESFFTHLGEPRYRAGLLAECVGLLELLFSAPHPTVTGLERVNGQWSPLCGDWETTAGQRECLEMVSQSAMAFVADMLAVEKKLTAHEAPFGYLESVLERILRHPTYDESSILGALPHRDSFGGKAPWRHLAKVPTLPQTVFKPSSLREAYARAYWKQGFVVQLGPTERRMIGV